MKQSSIHIKVGLDEQNVPDKIMWEADDSPLPEAQEAKAFTLAIWDGSESGTLKIDLWNKQMEVHEMKQFIIETISGLADTIRKATEDQVMAMDMENLCKSLSKRLEEELKAQQNPFKPGT